MTLLPAPFPKITVQKNSLKLILKRSFNVCMCMTIHITYYLDR